MRTNNVIGSCQADAGQSEESWAQLEFAGCQFKDERLSKRFSMVLKQLAQGTAESIPLACQDWANTKVAYRFFANERVSEADILAGHFRSTRERAATVGGALLVLHDTTEFFLSARKHRAAPSLTQCRPQPASVVRHLDALKSGRDASRAAARFVRGEVPDEEGVQGANELKRRVNPDAASKSRGCAPRRA